MTTFEQLQKLLAQDFDVAPERITPDTRLEDLDVDSLRMIEILFSVEEVFGITVSSDQGELRTRLQTIADLVAYIDSLVAAARRPAS